LEEELTDRELELLDLVAGGSSNRAIAHALSISENTVKYHMKNILAKLGVQNRTEAVARAIHLGLIDADAGSSPTSVM
jgi:ATP/maltotriose-dependent transcriptional regulator MalT